MRFNRLLSRLSDRLDDLEKKYLHLFTTSSARSVLTFLFIFIGFLWAWCIIRYWLGNAFSPDSHCYYLLGKNIFDGFGFTTFAVRDIHEEPAWPIPSRSFPPLFPFLVGLAHWLTGWGLQSGVLVNLLVLLGSLGAVVALSRVLAGKYWPLLALAYLYFFRFDDGYQKEIFTARSIPVSILIFMMFLWAFAKSLSSDKPTRAYEILAGVLLCLLPMARFDQFPFSILAIPFAFFTYRAFGFSKRKSLEKAGLVGACFVLAYLPWAIRSTILYGKPFTGNNMLAVISIFDGHAPISFWAPGQEPPTVFDNFWLWYRHRRSYLLRNWDNIALITKNLVYLTPLMATIFWSRLTKVQKAVGLLCVLQAILHIAVVSTTPYRDVRYWAQIHLNMCLFLGVTLVVAVRSMSFRHWQIILTGLVIAACLTSTLFKRSSMRALGRKFFGGYIIPGNLEKYERRYQSMMRFYSPYITPDTVFSTFRYSEAFTYFTNQRTVMFPYNVRDISMKNMAIYAWLDKWKPDYLLIHEEYKKRFKRFLTRNLTVASREGDALVDAKKLLRNYKTLYPNGPLPLPPQPQKATPKKRKKPKKPKPRK